jgi:sigma54-dependent transcription regulator
MVILGDEDQMEARFSLFGDSVSFIARLVYGLRQMKHSLRKLFWMHQMVLLGDEAQMEACFGPFRYSASLDSR